MSAPDDNGELERLRAAWKTLVEDMVKITAERDKYQAEAKRVNQLEIALSARNDAWLAEHARVLKLEEQLSDALDHAEFLEKDIGEIVGMLGKKRRKRNQARLDAMADAYLARIISMRSVGNSIEVVHTREIGKLDQRSELRGFPRRLDDKSKARLS